MSEVVLLFVYLCVMKWHRGWLCVRVRVCVFLCVYVSLSLSLCVGVWCSVVCFLLEVSVCVGGCVSVCVSGCGCVYVWRCVKWWDRWRFVLLTAECSDLPAHSVPRVLCSWVLARLSSECPSPLVITLTASLSLSLRWRDQSRWLSGRESLRSAVCQWAEVGVRVQPRGASAASGGWASPVEGSLAVRPSSAEAPSLLPPACAVGVERSAGMSVWWLSALAGWADSVVIPYTSIPACAWSSLLPCLFFLQTWTECCRCMLWEFFYYLPFSLSLCLSLSLVRG